MGGNGVLGKTDNRISGIVQNSRCKVTFPHVIGQAQRETH